MTCQKLKDPAPGNRINPPLMSRPQPVRPWEIVAMDAMSVAGKDVMIFVDTFTRYPEACVIEGNLNGRNLSDAFVLHVLLRHGCPSKIICDNVSYQVQGQFKETTELLGIQVTPVSAYHPQANGIAESKVKALKSLLRSISADNPTDWEANVPLALFAYRSAFHSAIGDKPFYLEHGRDPVLPGNLSLGLENARRDMNRMNLRQYTLELERRMESAFRLAATNLRATQDLYMTPHQMGEHYFEIGDQVFLFHPVVGKDEVRTFKQWWQGPFEVIDRKSPVIYSVRNLSNANDVRNVYVSRLKKKH